MFNLILLVLLVPHYGMAYIDPGSGHLLSQLFLAMMAGITFQFRHFFHSIYRRFIKKQSCDRSPKLDIPPKS